MMVETLSPPATTQDSSSTASPRLHLDFLDGARACAALYVLVYHSFEHTWDFSAGQSPPAWFSRATFFLQSGRFAVSLFIIISGFCLMLPVIRNQGILKGGTLNFLGRRARRILPPYYLTLMISALLMFTLLAQRSNVSFPRSIPAAKEWLLFHGLLVQNWQPFFNPHYREVAHLDLADILASSPAKQAEIGKLMSVEFDANSPLWSIAVEWQIYFFFPLLVYLWRKIGPGWSTTLTLLLSYSFYTRFHHLVHGWMAPHYLGLFALGMLGAKIAYGEEEKWRACRDKRFWKPTAYALWTVVLIINIDPLRCLQYAYLVDLIAGPASLCLLVAASKAGRNRLRDLLSHPKLVQIGTFSYSIYLLHDPLLRVCLSYPLAPLAQMKLLQWCLLMVPGVPLIVGVIYLFHLIGERPFLNAPVGGHRKPMDVRPTLQVPAKKDLSGN